MLESYFMRDLTLRRLRAEPDVMRVERGRVAVASTSGKGSTFTVNIPVRLAPSAPAMLWACCCWMKRSW